MSATDALEQLGWSLMDSHGCFESWLHNDRCIEIDTYEAMVARMRERENTRRD